MAVGMALIFLFFFGAATFAWQGFQVRLEPVLSWQGFTEIRLPPAGVIRARTHLTPLGLRLTLEEVDLARLMNLLSKSFNREVLTQEAIVAGKRFLLIYLLRLLALSALGGGLGVILLRQASWRRVLWGAVTGTLSVLVLILGTYFSYSPAMFRHAEYRGSLAAAPWIINVLERALEDMDRFRKQVEILAQNITAILGQMSEIQSFSGDTYNQNPHELKVLHISDIHNNPAGYDIVEAVIRTFDVDLIIDTGDISDFGTPLEAQLTARIKKLKVPYLFAAGNHDSPEILRSMAKIPNVKLLQGKVTEVKGLRILGFPDPLAASNEIQPLDGAALGPYVDRIDTTLEGIKVKPHLLAVHNPNLALPFAGRLPVILYGHDHRLSLKEYRGSVICDAGTTGAAGLRSLTSPEKVSYSLVLLRFQDTGQGWQLKAADTIRLNDLQGSFHLERQIFFREEGRFFSP
ncbi:MAG: hypothetical protein PWP65_1272 [Clostridia bacterium]|nr:hypothetical protein [Clostridia bacterium]